MEQRIAEPRIGEPRIGRDLVVEGRRVHVLEEGTGRPLVVLHGCGSLAEEVLASLTGRLPGFRILALDRPGYGRSDPLPVEAAGPSAQAAWLADVFDALGLDAPLLAAHSLGSAPALLFALDRPERLSGLLLVAPFCRPTPHRLMPLLRLAGAPVLGDFLRCQVVPILAPRIGPSRMSAVFRPNPVPDYLNAFPFGHAASPPACLTMATELLAFNTDMAEREDDLASLAVPTVVLHGTEDAIATPDWHARWLTDRAPAVTLELLQGVGHVPHHVRPEALIAAIRRLDAVRPRRSDRRAAVRERLQPVRRGPMIGS